MDENTVTDEAVHETTDQPAAEPEDIEATERTDEASEPETFPREYVQRLRDEAAKYRQRAQQTDALAVMTRHVGREAVTTRSDVVDG